MANQEKIKIISPLHHDEQILVVKRATFFGQEEAWSGIKAVNMDFYLKLINEHKEFLPRSLMEQDPQYKQIIPYLIFKYENRYFLMQRRSNATESRLQNKYSLGIGGHIRHEDMLEDMSILAWAKREFHEEISYDEAFVIKPLGIINDDSNDVGKVHVGLVCLVEGSSNNIAVKSELKSGMLMTLDALHYYVENMETWSQMIFNFLREELPQ